MHFQGYRMLTGLVARPWCLMEICSKQEIINIVTDATTETTKLGLFHFLYILVQFITLQYYMKLASIFLAINNRDSFLCQCKGTPFQNKYLPLKYYNYIIRYFSVLNLGDGTFGRPLP